MEYKYIIDSDSDSDYEIDFDNSYDHSNEDTGTDIFIVDHKYIDYKGFPDIYDPFYPHIELIQSNDIMNNIIKYIAKNNNFKSIIPLKCVNKFMKNFVDDFMKAKGKKFYHKIINRRFMCDQNCIICRDNMQNYGSNHRWRMITLRLLNMIM